ncbi:MAG: sodium:calcium antiporter [Deltaproteobacteria bacterium]|nr:sodium:calcium antiporter [Deltaproteobacteria bacterium]MBM4298641.1 sodium:calcium antiporter [Deltaproteobacteria bacterium]
MNDYIYLIAGIVCAGLGGELFVRGSVGLARSLRIPPGIVGATVAAFATSSPELAVSVSSALAHVPQIALGDALGSNVVNVALILALALTIAAIRCPRDSVKRDYTVALLLPVITGVLILDGQISRLDGAVLICIFVAWLIAVIIAAQRQRSATGNVLGERKLGKAIAECVVGLALLVSAGYLIVNGARGIAVALGIGEFVIGATVVAVGTSVPELATAIIAKMRGHDEVGLGTVLGSNIFNGVFIIGVAALIYPITVAWRDVTVALVFGFLAVAFTFPLRGGMIERRRGFLLLVLYAVYLGVILQR